MVVYLVRTPSFYIHQVRPQTHPSSMTIVLNDPSWWPTISLNIYSSYITVASSAAVIYDWALTSGQEVELVWRQPWSIMTVLYLGVRYMGIMYAIVNMLNNIPSLSMSDAVRVSRISTMLVQYNDRNSCFHIFYATLWISVVAYAMLSVIMIARLHAMYQRSRKMLIFLVVIFLAVYIPSGVIIGITTRYILGGEMVLSGTYKCNYEIDGRLLFLSTIPWVLYTVWEVLALCLAVRIAVKHFRRLGPSTGQAIKDFFMVLIQNHVVCFATFVGASCFNLSTLYSNTMFSDSAATLIYVGNLVMVVQVFVLGPRFVLSIRGYRAEPVSDTRTAITSVAFQEHVHESTGSGV